ncbi:uncharacterized protein PpBr36_10654, partial [Pyricularia pennisetigena]|uniref:uncharacterized protein n=1 Tax=Pyricularia pennisetigena TaxID=1578925 RepID=UPI0011548888
LGLCAAALPGSQLDGPTSTVTRRLQFCRHSDKRTSIALLPSHIDFAMQRQPSLPDLRFSSLRDKIHTWLDSTGLDIKYNPSPNAKKRAFDSDMPTPPGTSRSESPSKRQRTDGAASLSNQSLQSAQSSSFPPTSQSNASTSRRLRSPKKTADRFFGKVFNANASLGNQPETPLPPDMLSLYENIVDIHDNTTPIYPLGAKKQIQTLIRNTLDDRFIPDPDFEQQDDKKKLDAAIELDDLQAIQKTAERCARYLSHEATWNSDVHARILRRAAAPYSGITAVGATTAGIQLEWRSGIAADDASNGSKMVDYLLIIDDSDIELGHAIRKHTRMVNHTSVDDFLEQPIGISIETKVSQTLSNQGRLQLGNWSASLLYRWSQLPSLCTDSCHKPEDHVAPPMVKALPIVLITGHFWEAYFFCDEGDNYQMYGPIDLGNTRSLKEIYKLLASLRVLVRWVDVQLRDWFHRLFHVR